MDPLIGSSLILSGSGLLGGLTSFLGGKSDFSDQKKLMNYQNQLNIQNWNMQNEYNSPANIMKRYEQAGLNPNLIYGNNGISASSLPSPTPQKVDRGQVAAAQAMQYMDKMLQLKMLSTQIKGQEIDNEAKTQSIEETRERINGLRIGNQRADFDLNLLRETRGDSLASIKANRTILENQASASKYAPRSAELDNLIKSQNLSNLQVVNKKLNKEIDLFDSRIKLTDAQCNAVASTILLNAAMTDYTWARSSSEWQRASRMSEYIDAEIRRFGMDVRVAGANMAFRRLEYRLLQVFGSTSPGSIMSSASGGVKSWFTGSKTNPVYHQNKNGDYKFKFDYGDYYDDSNSIW